MFNCLLIVIIIIFIVIIIIKCFLTEIFSLVRSSYRVICTENEQQ